MKYLKKILPQSKWIKKGLHNILKDLKNKRFIFIDTNLANTHKGHYCEYRQRWLKIL